MTSIIHKCICQDPCLQESFSAIERAVTLSAVIIACLQFGIVIARTVASEILTQRGHAEGGRPSCPNCGTHLESKGLLSRSMKSLLGTVSWTRRVWRCPRGCKIGQVVPLDRELHIQPNQRVSHEVQRVACALAVFVPFGLAAALLKLLTGVDVSSGGIWNWVQSAGKDAMTRLEQALKALEERVPEANARSSSLANLPLLLGGDGVMVPFRPHGGSPRGKTVWREVKVGILARLGQRVTRTGKTVSVLVHRQLVAVLGNIDAFKASMWLSAVKEGFLTAHVVVWLSDGGRGFWGVFHDLFSERAQGILDFYHAAQNIWKGAKGWLDGRTTTARQWFDKARHHLRHGHAATVISELKEGVTQEQLPASVRHTMENVIAYLEGHIEHIDYAHYKELGLPLGSGMVESACKWLIQQRFKCVGMRWSEDGFHALLHLRLAWVNGTFDELFDASV